jgi:acetyl esterase/lipase
MVTVSGMAVAQPAAVVRLWPGAGPGEGGKVGTERDTTPKGPDGKPQDNIIRLGDVSEPTLTIYKPPKRKDTGAAVIVCPGGGYHILAWDLEGTEVCAWLNSIGVTGVLLKYRVPSHADSGRRDAPLYDARRAVRLVRHNAAAWGIDPARVGMLGFSAGGNLIARLTSSGTSDYARVDDADAQDATPDFTLLIYPAIPTDAADRSRPAPPINVGSHTPPTFMVMTQDDPIGVEGVYAYASALKASGVSAELHVFPTGGHGYGLRPSKHAVSGWPALAAAWLKAEGWLRKRG